MEQVLGILKLVIFSVVGVYLIINGHPGWGILSLFIILGNFNITVNGTDKKPEETLSEEEQDILDNTKRILKNYNSKEAYDYLSDAIKELKKELKENDNDK